jgi:hypothetical protein
MIAEMRRLLQRLLSICGIAPPKRLQTRTVLMPANYSPGLIRFGLLPEPEGRSASFLTSTVVNSIMLAVMLIIGMTAKHVIDERKYEQTELIIPTTPPPEKVKLTEPPKLPDPPKPPDVKLEAPKI